MTEASEAAIEIHQVTVACAALERLLRARGAVGRGMGELVQSVEEDLPMDIASKLLGLASARNRVIHQAEPLGPVRFEMFMVDVRAVEAYLEPIVVGQLMSGDKSDVATTLLPIRSGPSARTVAEAEDAKVAGERARQFPARPLSSPSQSFSPPAGHPARLQADRRAALRKVAAFPWWFVLGVAVQMGLAGWTLVSRRVPLALLPVMLTLMVTGVVAALPGGSFRRLWPLVLGTFLLMSAVLVWLAFWPQGT